MISRKWADWLEDTFNTNNKRSLQLMWKLAKQRSDQRLSCRPCVTKGHWAEPTLNIQSAQQSGSPNGSSAETEHFIQRAEVKHDSALITCSGPETQLSINSQQQVQYQRESRLGPDPPKNTHQRSLGEKLQRHPSAFTSKKHHFKAFSGH